MNTNPFLRTALFILVISIVAPALVAQTIKQASLERSPNVAVDREYTDKINEYTTRKEFNSPLTNYLPESSSVPTPKALLGDVAGAPGILPYSKQVHDYMRMVERASPRVKVYSIGTSEEGREMIAVAVSSEANLAKLEANRERLSKLADPRKIDLNDEEAEKIIADTVPVYYLTGAIHSPETGSPTALMELVYRLAVDESKYIQDIRNNLITLITPVVETDGRDRQVDVYNWHLANPGKNWPNLVYWGHYVAHDNNRDSMALSLNLTRNVLNTYIDWKVQVLHDLHESVPYLYDNTIGTEPYNAWIDPILADEWQLIGWNNVAEMTKFGMPGVFAHGTFDTWSPSYLMFIAASHNGISRLYETFGNGGADTIERELSPSQYERRWYRQNPPYPKTLWSQRNNNNYQQTGILVSLAHFAANGKFFLGNFYKKSKNSILKPRQAGPAAYVFPGDERRPAGQAELLNLLKAQGNEVHRAMSAFTVEVPGEKKGEKKTREFPAGSYLVRMDQPYSRIADMMLDKQFWSPIDPQENVYDDTGWTFGALNNVEVVRVTDQKVLDASMDLVDEAVTVPGVVEGNGPVYLVNHNADNTLVTLRYRFPEASFEAAEEPFKAGGRDYSRGSFIITGVDGGELSRTAQALDLRIQAAAAKPSVKTHPVRAPRIAIMHTWLNTQDEGWWRIEFDRFKVPYDYISTQDAAADPNLRAKYDVIIFAPVGRGASSMIIEGIPMYGNPIPWKQTELTPNLGRIDSTDDMRPGLGFNGLKHLRDFVANGGLFITARDTSSFAVEYGFAPGVSERSPSKLRLPGSVLASKTVDEKSPLLYGYQDGFSIFAANGPFFGVSNFVGGRGFGAPSDRPRMTGRGSAEDPDTVQNRPPDEIPEPPAPVEKWQAQAVTEADLRNGVRVIPPAMRPRVVLRYGDAKGLLVSGLLDGGGEIAQTPAVIDVPHGRGHVILFSNNPFWRAETQGSYFLVFNAILNWDNLNAGRALDNK
ncbi:MAG TPA: M14 family zinc carboxypeptidase [Aridibacter sp.]|nr:M14 family zinc carboxypeptidase [Aridibacter sp.]